MTLNNCKVKHCCCKVYEDGVIGDSQCGEDECFCCDKGGGAEVMDWDCCYRAEQERIRILVGSVIGQTPWKMELEVEIPAPTPAPVHVGLCKDLGDNQCTLSQGHMGGHHRLGVAIFCKEKRCIIPIDHSGGHELQWEKEKSMEYVAPRTTSEVIDRITRVSALINDTQPYRCEVVVFPYQQGSVGCTWQARTNVQQKFTEATIHNGYGNTPDSALGSLRENIERDANTIFEARKERVKEFDDVMSTLILEKV